MMSWHLSDVTGLLFLLLRQNEETTRKGTTNALVRNKNKKQVETSLSTATGSNQSQSKIFILDISNDDVTTHVTTTSRNNMADMVASGKTHKVIGTKLWNMQHGGWILVPGGVSGWSLSTEGRLIPDQREGGASGMQRRGLVRST